jgi:hypothetical protein
MTLTPAEAETAYRLILGRTPSEAEIAHVIGQYDKMAGLRHIMLSSEEFHKKFDHIRADFVKNLTPILVHLHIPEATDATVFDQLGASADLQPALAADAEAFASLCKSPRPDRIKLRYIYGDLIPNLAEGLRVPYVHLCTIARPGPRLYRLYLAACVAQEGATMSFGSYLKYSVTSMAHRIECDNGQTRRLANARGEGSFGREDDLLARALNVATSPKMIFGLFENTPALLARLVRAGLLEASAIDLQPVIELADPAYEKAVSDLSKEARGIFDTYIAWDEYLYDVCAALFIPSTS